MNFFDLTTVRPILRLCIKNDQINGKFLLAMRSGASEGLSYLPVITKTTHTESGYTTLGEAIRRLDLVEAIADPEKANFVFRVLEMTVQHKLLSLSGSAIRRLFCIISKVGFTAILKFLVENS